MLRTLVMMVLRATGRERLVRVPKPIRRIVSRLRGEDRSDQLRDEVEFWRRFLTTGGGDRWQADFRRRLDPEQPVQAHVARLVDRLEGECVRILDVGAGPLTKLGKRHRSKRLEITATDLLAPEYDRLLRELGIEPLVRTVAADAERLVERFGSDAFDLVHGQNCVDHMEHPLVAVEQMLAVTRPGGWVVLYHTENEGRRQSYNQLHRWDFTCDGGRFVIGAHRGRAVDVTRTLADRADVECEREGDAIVTAIRKRPAAPPASGHP